MESLSTFNLPLNFSQTARNFCEWLHLKLDKIFYLIKEQFYWKEEVSRSFVTQKALKVPNHEKFMEILWKSNEKLESENVQKRNFDDFQSSFLGCWKFKATSKKLRIVEL